MAKNLILDPILVQVLAPKIIFEILPPLVVRHCSMLSSYAIQKKNNDPNSRKWQKKLILGLIKAHWTLIWATYFSFLKSGFVSH